jgi:hypothetical protein
MVKTGNFNGISQVNDLLRELTDYFWRAAVLGVHAADEM